jgi:hypothetical protein
MDKKLKLFDIKKFYVKKGRDIHVFVGAIVYEKLIGFEILNAETDEIERYEFNSILDAKRVKLGKEFRSVLEHNAKMWHKTLSRIDKGQFLKVIENALNQDKKFRMNRGKVFNEEKLSMRLVSGDRFDDKCIKVQLESSIDIQKISPSSRDPESYIRNLSKNEYGRLVKRFAGNFPKIKEKKNKNSLVKFQQGLKIEDRKWVVLETKVKVKLKADNLTKKNALKVASLIEFE